MGGSVSTPRRLVSGAALVCLLAAALFLSGPRAHGAFPGENGRIAFADDRGGGSHIFTMTPAGRHVKRLTDTSAFDASPAYSPSGKSITFVRATGPKPGIYRIKPNGTHLDRLTADPSDTEPAFSPSGRKIVFTRGGGVPEKRGPLPPGPDIWIMRANGTHAHPLTEDPATDDFPAFSPNGKRIAFSSVRDGDPEIFMMKADGSGEHAITDNDDGDYDPNFAPGGGRITFASDRAGANFDVFAMRPNGSHQRRLTTNDSFDGFPAYSPNGKRIAFETDRGKVQGERIFAMRADGTKERPISRGSSGGIEPDWGPRP
jgi:Tol biopolymer transport system component